MKLLRQGLVSVAAWLVGLLLFVPILWTVLTSFKTEEEAVSPNLHLFNFAWTLSNYIEVQNRSDYFRHFWNSVVISFGSTMVGLVIAVMAAWGLAFFPRRSNREILSWMLSTKMMPA
ncbi:MAG: carbohydrate ABC transporter permease, partial [Alphaproteobacteria bacterium]|nr:carbohydrate ABC transporter permease [Alphaproteobacteria bacterium]